MSHPVDVHVGRKLKQVRTSRRMSQTDVAKKLGLSFQQIQKYEIGSNRIAASRLYELSKILEVPTSYFFEGMGADDMTTSLGDSTLDIVNAVAAITDPAERTRIVKLIEDVSGNAVRQSA
ncbi:MAG: helix-turn-helix transcriptional regulator [Pseudomonadota bacterium]